MIIIFEGADASGKDYVRRQFEQNNGYENTCITRFFASQLVYAWYYKRDLWMNQDRRMSYVQTARGFLQKYRPLIVYLHAGIDITEKRIQARNEKVCDQPNHTNIKHMFAYVFDLLECNDQTLFVDTSNAPIDRIIDDIEFKIECMEDVNGKPQDSRGLSPRHHGNVTGDESGEQGNRDSCGGEGDRCGDCRCSKESVQDDLRSSGGDLGQ